MTHTTDGAAATATDVAYERLKRAILTCALAPGSELREAQLADDFELGRTPVRGALGRLVQDGFVEVRPRKGYRVTDLKITDVNEVFELRSLIEPAACELAAARAPRPAIEALHDLAHAEYDHTDPASYEQFIVDNREFHVRLAVAAGNQRLARSIRTLLEEMQRLFFLSLTMRDTSSEQMHEHHALYDAILAGDAPLARKISADQIEQSRRRVIESLITGFGPASLGASATNLGL
ncbi:GntR family transcriptional regulator [Jiangella aurantiaca]|uniref:GntR family transcriptional regulator n=1 Tax=Jiangella aurantiaca TaxID=2530373 RepID=A0A4R5A0V3_9ACTN|nr:GntR family transcriptional regulator [Jiangella aurantiaca]TDD64356.1 GntR family transcriptional regulator [Jiangella aurantiaca]